MVSDSTNTDWDTERNEPNGGGNEKCAHIRIANWRLNDLRCTRADVLYALCEKNI